MNGDHVIGAARLDDVLAIATFQTLCWREAYRGLVPDDYLDGVTEQDRERRWRERMESGSREVAVGWAEVQIAGVVSWGAADSGPPHVELKSLYVAAKHRGSGLAETLAERAVGAGPAQLWVFDGNLRAQRFYRRLGFKPDGSRSVDPDTGVWQLRYVR